MRAPWLPYNPVRTYPERTREAYVDALAQFQVETNERYVPWNGRTYCNIFLWDGTRALCCEIPHWVDENGNGTVPFAKGSRELSANAIERWLIDHGGRHGWVKADLPSAKLLAAIGQPVILQWTNPTGESGHVAFLLPTGDVIQAGKRNGVMSVGAAFGQRLFTCWTNEGVKHEPHH